MEVSENERSVNNLTDEQLGIFPASELDIQKQILQQVRSIRAAVYFFVWIVGLTIAVTAIYWLYAYAWD